MPSKTRGTTAMYLLLFPILFTATPTCTHCRRQCCPGGLCVRVREDHDALGRSPETMHVSQHAIQGALLSSITTIIHLRMPSTYPFLSFPPPRTATES